MNVVALSGNTTRDIEIRRTQGGMPIASFGIAVNERRKNGRTGEWETVPNYFDVVAFGERWERIAQYAPKGTQLAIQGKLRYSSWEKDGQKRSKVEIVAEDVDLPPRQQQGNRQGGYQHSQPEYVEATYMDDPIPF